MLMATHLINHLCSRIWNWKSPYEMLYKKKLDYSVLCNFSILVHYIKVKPQRDNFISRAEKGVSVGYFAGQKAFKVYSLDNKKVVVCRDVVFNESAYPFIHKSSFGDETFKKYFSTIG